MSRFEEIVPPRIEWGATLCRLRGCAELAVLAFEDWPYCLDHGEDAWERALAWEINPSAAAMMLQADR